MVCSIHFYVFITSLSSLYKQYFTVSRSWPKTSLTTVYSFVGNTKTQDFWKLVFQQFVPWQFSYSPSSVMNEKEAKILGKKLYPNYLYSTNFNLSFSNHFLVFIFYPPLHLFICSPLQLFIFPALHRCSFFSFSRIQLFSTSLQHFPSSAFLLFSVSPLQHISFSTLQLFLTCVYQNWSSFSFKFAIPFNSVFLFYNFATFFLEKTRKQLLSQSKKNSMIIIIVITHVSKNDAETKRTKTFRV